MRNEKFLISIFLFLICIVSACEKKSADKIPAGFENSKDLSYSKIEDVDFRNFSYSFINNFTIINGEKPLGKLDETGYRLRNIQYADLTNDGKNEAIINIQTLFVVNQSNVILIYTLENEQPKKLQHILSGLNANGGLKNVYAKENVLTIEFFGNTKFDENKREFVFPNIQKYPEAECCPNKFTKFDFKWNGKEFMLAAKPEIIDYNWKKESHENLFNRK